MKRLVLVFASLLIGLTTATVSATETSNQKQKNKLDKTKKHRYAQPIMFEERGVEFLIFPDGSFDFNTHIQDDFYNDSYYRKNSRRSSINTTQRGPNAKGQYNSNRYPNRGVSISRDRNGNVRRIGNVYLNYDRRGKITRVGSIFINYSRGHNATLTQVGGLRVHYNHWGEIVNTRGQVSRYSKDYCNFCGVQSCDVTHNFGNGNGHGNNHNNQNNDWNDNDDVYNNDDNYYYFKQNGKVKKHKKNKR